MPQDKARVAVVLQANTRRQVLHAQIATRESTPATEGQAVRLVQLEIIQLRWELHQVVIVKRAMLARTL